jgi:hypothetical protein
LVKPARFAELYGMMKPAVHHGGQQEMHDNMEKKHLLMLEHVKRCHLFKEVADAFEKERGMSIKRVWQEQQYNDYCFLKR